MEQGRLTFPAPMNAERRRALAELLKEAYADTMRIIVQLKAGDNPLATSDREVDEMLLRGYRTQAARIVEAQGRLTSGEYGNCEKCGNEIDVTSLRGLFFKKTCKLCDELERAEETRDRQRREFGVTVIRRLPLFDRR